MRQPFVLLYHSRMIVKGDREMIGFVSVVDTDEATTDRQRFKIRNRGDDIIGDRACRAASTAGSDSYRAGNYVSTVRVTRSS